MNENKLIELSGVEANNISGGVVSAAQVVTVDGALLMLGVAALFYAGYLGYLAIEARSLSVFKYKECERTCELVCDSIDEDMNDE